jgi:type VI secretion system secreted protein Hcp
MFDAFIKIDRVEGESTDDKHSGWIEVVQYGMGVKQTDMIRVQEYGAQNRKQ